MKKSKFVKSTIILLIGGLITKILGMLIKIITTRIIGSKTLSLYMLIMPTYSLFITIAQLGFPISISKLVSEKKYINKKIISNSLWISLIVNIILMLIIISTSNIICTILHNKDLYYPLIAISTTLPFISLSSIIRGYFFGKEKMLPHVISNIIEQLSRIMINITLLPYFTQYGNIITILFLISSNIITETISIIIMYIFLPKKIIITKKDLKKDNVMIKNILNISIPITSSRLIGTIGYFFEPIIITNFLLLNNYSLDYITYEYGIITGYVLPFLLLPSFFTNAISQALIPVISNSYVNKNIKYTKYKIKQALIISGLIGLIFTTIIFIFPNQLLKLIYNTNEGINYLKILCPFFFLLYIQTPINAIMQSINKSKDAMKSTLYAMIIKIILLILFSFTHIGIYNLIISSIVNIIYVTLSNYLKIKKALK